MSAYSFQEGLLAENTYKNRILRLVLEALHPMSSSKGIINSRKLVA
jgi:hypothetical protein